MTFKRSGSCIDSPDWIKKKKETINPKNTDDKCFQYAATVALNYEEVESHPERISNIKPFLDKYNWKGTYYLLKIIGNRVRKIIQQLLLIFCILKKNEYVQLISQNLCEKKLFY